MLERQREGIAKAKAEGKYRDTRPTARAKAPRFDVCVAEASVTGARSDWGSVERAFIGS